MIGEKIKDEVTLSEKIVIGGLAVFLAGVIIIGAAMAWGLF